MSTAYCTRDKRDVRESVEAEGVSVERLLDASEWLEAELLEGVAKRQLFGERHSSYHFTKSLAEGVFAADHAPLPLAIVRPSIIGAAWREPTPGWVDNYNGLSGFLVAAGKGVLRTLHARPDAVCDVIPVDFVVNTCLASAAAVAVRRPADAPLVVNCVSGQTNPITWRQIRDFSAPLLLRWPSSELFRFPGVSLHSSAFLHYCHLLAEHRIPAAFVDLLFRACGLQPM